MQQACSSRDVVNIGSSSFNGMDQAGVLVHTDLDFHAEVQLVTLFGLMHLRLPHPILVSGGAGSCDQGGIDDRALLHGHASLLEMAYNRLIDEVLRSSGSSLRVRYG